MSSGVVTLGQIAARLSGLDVACNRCERRGRLWTRTLLAKHGPALAVPVLRGIVAADCSRMIEGRMHDGCGVHFPQLARLVW